jgi:hypothetical protein
MQELLAELGNALTAAYALAQERREDGVETVMDQHARLGLERAVAILDELRAMSAESTGYALKCRGSGLYFRECHGDDHALDDATLYPTEADAHRVRGIHHRVVRVHVDANGRTLADES